MFCFFLIFGFCNIVDSAPNYRYTKPFYNPLKTVNYNNSKREVVLNSGINKTTPLMDNSNMECSYDYGFKYIVDSYARSPWSGALAPKAFVTYVYPDSSAQTVGLYAGDEIIKIDGIKLNKMDVNNFASVLNLSNSVKLEIKHNKEKREVYLSKNRVCRQKLLEDNIYTSYWVQICSLNIENIAEDLYYAETIKHKLSNEMINMLNVTHQNLMYWFNKKKRYNNNYQICRTSSLNNQDLHNCMSAVVKNELTIIEQEKAYALQQEQIRLQREAYEAQQYIQKKQIEALNNYSNALRNQRVRVDTNIYHSGDVDVNLNRNWVSPIVGF